MSWGDNNAGAAGAWDSGAASSSWNQEPATDGGNGFSNEHGRMANTGQATIITGGSDNKCRICQLEGHFSRDCPDKAEGGGGSGCFNCGEEGHSKADCTKERVFMGECRVCSKTGHRASDCPEKPPVTCGNCKQEGHATITCTENRVFDISNIAIELPDKAWELLRLADAEKDLDDIRAALKVYCKAVPGTTYDELEHGFRRNGFNTHLIAFEKEIPVTFTLINLQGELDKKYQVGLYFDTKPKRDTAQEGWPTSAKENLERLKEAGLPMERGVSKCNRCNELGHSAKNCPEEVVEIDRVSVKCVNCEELGHRVRDCPKARKDRFACRNCKQSGHAAADCTEPRSAEGIECNRCHEMGHFSKECPNFSNACRNCGEDGHKSADCEKPKNPAVFKCRNCEVVGHFTRDCPEPKDWSKVKCNNCGEMGHTIKRCKQPVADAEAGGDMVGESGVAMGSGGGQEFMGGGQESLAEPAGDWNAGGATGTW